ncbi:Quinone oxidoreductase 2 [compost metagenome]
MGWAGRRDYAAAAARVLAGEGHHNTVYELSGKPLTQEELASIVAGVSGREIEVQQVDDESYGRIMVSAGVPEAMIPFVVGIQRDIREGALDVESNDFDKLLDRPITPLGEVLKQIIN